MKKATIDQLLKEMAEQCDEARDVLEAQNEILARRKMLTLVRSIRHKTDIIIATADG